MKLLKGDAGAFYAILFVFVLVFFSSNPSIASLNTADSPQIDSTDISSQDFIADADPKRPGAVDNLEEEKSAEAPDLEAVEAEQTVAAASLQNTADSEEAADSPAVSTPTVNTYQFTGAASGNIPILVPPGRNGIQPNLALTYNSYMKNGWIGVGWSLDMGCIQRSTKRGVNYAAKTFVVSAAGSTSQLVRRSEWGTNFYGAKIESAFTKYYLNPATGGWEATAKNGTTYFYGTTARSRQDDPQDSSRIFKWCLDGVEDTNGNYMTVSYVKHQGQIYLEQIEYTGNSKAGAAPFNTVRFHLDPQPRADAYPVMTSNFEVTTAKKLKSIEVIGNNELARVYQFNYTESESTQHTLLQSVQQYGSDASIDGAGNVSGAHVLPAIEFEWVTDAHNTFSAAFDSDDGIEGFNFGSERDRALAFDYNGDGKSDLFLYRLDSGKAAVARWDEHSQTYEQVFYSSSGINRFTFNSIRDRALAFDYNGDGKSDLFMYRPNSGIAAVAKWNEDNQAFDEVYYSKDGIAEFNFGSDRDRAFAFDYNGDGKSDLFLYRPDSGKVYIAKSDGKGNFSAVYSSNKGMGRFNFKSARDNAFAFDFNGDGFSDLFFYRPDSGKACVIRSNGDDTFDEVFYSSKGMHDYNLKGNRDQAFPFDFNADGKSDIFLYRPNSNLVGIMRSNGDGTFEQVYYSHDGIAGYQITSDRDRIFPFDYNGDGKSDLFMYRPDSGRVGVGRSLGDGDFERVYYETDGIAGYDMLGSKDQALALDYDGNGKSDIFLFRPNNSLCTIAQSGFNFPDLLSKIDNGFGGTTEIEYTPSSHYKNTKLNFIVHPVSKISVHDGIGTPAVNTFNYAGGYFHSGSRELRGFKTVIQTNAVDSPYEVITETKFHQDFYRKGRQYQVRLKESETNAVLSKTRFTWDRLYFNSGAFVRLLQKLTESYDDATVTSKEVYTYNDTNGNLDSKTTSGTNAEDVTLRYRHLNLSDWMWRKIRETVVGSDTGKVRETYLSYVNDGTGNLLYKTFWLSDGDNPKIRYVYDQYGNQKTVIDPRGNRTTTVYDAATRTYPVKITYPKTNGVDHIVRNQAWDYRFGKVKTTKDENGHRTYYYYDEFGRPVKVVSPNGGQVNTTYVDDEFPRYVVTKVKENSSGSTIDAYQHIDGLGREIQTIIFGEDGKTIATKKSYDALGRNDLIEGPFFSTDVQWPFNASGAYPWQQTNFDLRGRPEIIQSGDGEYGFAALSFYYNGLATTIEDDDGGSKTEFKDYLGRVIRVVEHADQADYTTDYTYNAAGDLLTVKDHYNNTTTIGYDTLGRKKSMNDPDMGYWEYTYDANGNMLTQTDEKLQTVTFAYDELNRATSKTYSTSDSTVTYQYDNLAVPNGRGRLFRVINAHSTTTYNAYDEMGNVTRVSKKIAGDPANYSTRYEYDLSGKVTRTIYPDGYDVTNDYHAGSGLLAAVRDPNGSLLAYLSNYTPSGKIGRIEYRNTVVTEYEYDSESTRLTSIVTHGPQAVSNHSVNGSLGGSQAGSFSTVAGHSVGGVGGQGRSFGGIGVPAPVQASYYQNKSYIYTPAGDIKQITDNAAGVTFHYTYDKLHRLKTETNTSSYDPISYTYDAVGNLLSKTVGGSKIDYTYDTWHKHAVKTINLNGFDHQYEYDDNGNMISGPDFSDPAQVAARSISYNADNMPTRIVRDKGGSRKTTDFVYDGDGVRVKKIISGNRTTYYIGAHYDIKDGVATKYIFAGNLRIAQIGASGTQYFHKDHLGSSTVITDAAGRVVESTVFMPFGTTRDHSGASASDYKYTDQEFDAETGLYNYNARLYDPIIGRFISADSIVQAPFDPQTLNRYSYCRNNPLIYIDPSGYSFFGLDILIGAAVGAITAAIQGDNIWEGALKGAISGAFFLIAGAAIDYYQITDPILEGVIKGSTMVASKVTNDAISKHDWDSSTNFGGGLFSGGYTSSNQFGNNTVGTTFDGSGPFANYSQTYGGNYDYKSAYYSANIVSQGYNSNGSLSKTIDKIYNGFIKNLYKGYYFGTGYGDYAANWYADRLTSADTWYEKLVYGAGLSLSVLWTPNTWYKTAGVLASGVYLGFQDPRQIEVITRLLMHLYAKEPVMNVPKHVPLPPAITKYIP